MHQRHACAVDHTAFLAVECERRHNYHMALYPIALAILLLLPDGKPSSSCRIMLDVPRGWTIVAQELSPEECVARLAPPDWKATREDSDLLLPEYPITLQISRRAIDDVAREAGFARVRDLRSRTSSWPELKDDEWLVCGKACAPGERIATKAWTGTIGEAVVWVGFSDPKRAGHTSGSEYRALLFENGALGRTISASCIGAGCATTFRQILMSVRFPARS
jgi:hypothetical protein